MAINIGDKRRMSASFTDPNDNDSPIDPTTLTFNLTSPSGEKITYVWNTDVELVQDSTGNFHVDYILNESGVWVYEFVGTGSAAQTEEETITVQRRYTV